MKHHFVPESYLKQFTRDLTGHFYKAKRGRKKVKAITTGGVCYKEDFYDIKDPQLLKAHGLNEKAYLEFHGFPYEKDWPNLIKNFKGIHYVDRSIHERLLQAYVSLKQRTHAFRKQFTDQKMLDGVFKVVTQQMYEQYKYLIEYHNVDYRKMIADQHEKMRDQIKFSEEMHTRGLIESVQGVNPAISDALLKLLSMNFEVVMPKYETDFFLTSDNPGFSLNGDQIWNTNFGKFDTVVFPISSKYAVVFQGFDSLNHLEVLKRVRYRRISSDEVDMINYSTLCVSDELLLCEDENFLNSFLSKHDYSSSVK